MPTLMFVSNKVFNLLITIIVMCFFPLSATQAQEDLITISPTFQGDTILFFEPENLAPYVNIECYDWEELWEDFRRSGMQFKDFVKKIVSESEFHVGHSRDRMKKTFRVLYCKNSKWNLYNLDFKQLNAHSYDSISSTVGLIPSDLEFPDPDEPHFLYTLILNTGQHLAFRNIIHDIFLFRNKKVDIYLSQVDSFLYLNADSIKPISKRHSFYGYFKGGKMGFICRRTGFISPLEYDSFKVLTGENTVFLHNRNGYIHLLFEGSPLLKWGREHPTHHRFISKFYLQNFTKPIDLIPIMCRHEAFWNKSKALECVPTTASHSHFYGAFCVLQNKEQGLFINTFFSYYLKGKKMFFHSEIKLDDFLNIWSKDYAILSVARMYRSFKNLEILLPYSFF
jgi:hypothetical protein